MVKKKQDLSGDPIETDASAMTAPETPEAPAASAPVAACPWTRRRAARIPYAPSW